MSSHELDHASHDWHELVRSGLADKDVA